MANQLDEMNGPVMENGRDINVINQRIPVKTGVGSVIFEVILWLLFIIPGVIFLFKKIKAKNYLAQVEQRIQHNASQIDNYLEQRVQIMQNMVSIVQKSVDLDTEVMTKVAALRSGLNLNDENRSTSAANIDAVVGGINVQLERYPELQSHGALREALQQNAYLQREITAAREIYNDTVFEWNRAINEWPTKMIVASKNGYTTRIPFATSIEVKEKARSNFFEK
ncbi:LemA family protein [Mycoplasmopsis californica HAZ160_1]|uniref:LemA family protein n=2 Tax=Mycoplasmopsis californica TaxID=2113 RepID=A0A059XME4_9BACT|nr:LemA family protein [Mycoplasmopsis californica]AIA29684.1 LemA family protein [Mycoplasmopsis californica]BAP00885.1 LemA family protein [Mycoplasmopsis californica HAZ160_1]BBG40744.1 LemA family protein [Mycoplasmopsis californica]BBG41338.1 LemA family protein [Mycoplasmopsis californica]BBG41931.1 LemA family protein [Mycoplasmopsis californica]